MSTQHRLFAAGGPRSANRPGYRAAARAGQAILALALVVVLLQGRYTGALTLAGFLSTATIFIRRADRLPSLFDLLCVLAALVNAIGWVWDLFERPGPYDELVHTDHTGGPAEDRQRQ